MISQRYPVFLGNLKPDGCRNAPRKLAALVAELDTGKGTAQRGLQGCQIDQIMISARAR